MLFLLDQDGPEPDDTERARKRGLHCGPQGRDGMVPVKGHLTPEAWAIYEAIFAKWAAPGMCNPDDENPCISGTASQEQIDNDHRTPAQRQHDALEAVGRHALQSGELGQHNGLSTSIIIRTTLQDLESRAGVGTTGGGTIMPINDVIRMAAHANHWLAIFDRGHRTSPEPVPRPTHRHRGPADHADRPRRRLHQTQLPRAGLRRPGPPRPARLG